MADARKVRSGVSRVLFAVTVLSTTRAAQAQEPRDWADLVPLIEHVQNREDIRFSATSRSRFVAGSVQDRCVEENEQANIMRFDVVVRNRGEAPFVIGDTPTPLCWLIRNRCTQLPQETLCDRDGASDGEFVWSDAHCHWHLRDFNKYRIVREDGSDAGFGQKQAFAILDWEAWSSTAPPGFFDDDHQGISVGWEDRYWGRHGYDSPHGRIDWALPCQFLKTTGLGDGSYRLLATVNAAQRFEEGRRDNNSIAVPLQITGNNVLTIDTGSPQPPQRLTTLGNGAAGPPAVASSEPHVTAYFYLSGNVVAARSRVFGAWTDEQVLEVPGGATSPPAAISTGNGTVDVVVRCGSGSLCRNRGTGLPPYAFSGWEQVPIAGEAGSMPALASSSPGQLDVFYRTTGRVNPGFGGLAHLAWNNGWTAVTSFGAPPGTTVASAPTVVARAGRHLNAFVRGADNQLWHVWHAPGTGFSSWDGPLGADVASDPKVTSWGTGRLDIFWRTAAGNLGHQWWQGGWGSGEVRGHPGVPLAGVPTAVSWGPDRVDIFARSTNNRLYHLHWDIRWGWGGWGQLWNDDDVASHPTVISWATNRLDVAFTTPIGELAANVWW